MMNTNLAIYSLALCLLILVQADDRPNILFILADDQSPFDLKAYNRTRIWIRQISTVWLGKAQLSMGAYHMGAWVGGVCTPSRHMIMSGRTVWHIPDKPGRTVNPHVTNPTSFLTDLVNYTMPCRIQSSWIRYHAHL